MSHSCEVWQSEQNLIIGTTNTSSSSSTQNSDQFMIDVFATHITADDRNPSLFTTSSRHSKFTAQRRLFLDLLYKTVSWSAISNMLSHMLVPFHAQPSMIHKISASAREIAARPPRKATAAVPTLVVSLVVVVGDIQVSWPDEEGRARVSERVRVGYLGLFGEEINCVICLEGILGRSSCSEVARLPCLHFFHEECISSWLEKSNLCPLCRYEMP